METFAMTETLPPPQLEHICDLAVTIAPPVEVGVTPMGLRRMIPITGGVVRGPRLNGKILPITKTPLSPEMTREVVLGVMTEQQRKEFAQTKECNFAISARGIGRFRVSAYYQRNLVGMVLRRIETSHQLQVQLLDLSAEEFAADLLELGSHGGAQPSAQPGNEQKGSQRTQCDPADQVEQGGVRYEVGQVGRRACRHPWCSLRLLLAACRQLCAASGRPGVVLRRSRSSLRLVERCDPGRAPADAGVVLACPARPARGLTQARRP